MNAKNIVAVLVVVVVIGGAIWYLSSTGKLGMPTPSTSTTATTTSDTVATVNGEAISRTQLTTAEGQLATQQGLSATSSAVLAQMQTQALNALVSQVLLRQAAQKSGIVASSTQVDAQIAADKKQLGTDAAYQQALITQGLTENDLRTQIAAALVMQGYLDQTLNLSAVTATDAEVQAAYKQLSTGQTNVPPLKQVSAQVKQLVIQQKQQQLINALADKLRTTADVKTLI